MNSLLSFLKLLSDETRLRILMLLNEGELCVCELCKILELSQPKVSQHLTKLRDLGLVQDERKGQWVYYRLSITQPVMQEIFSILIKNLQQYAVLVADHYQSSKIEPEHRLCDSLGKQSQKE